MILDRRTIAYSLCAAALLLAGAGTALCGWLFTDLPAISSLETKKVRPTTQILDRHGKLLYEVIDPAAGRQIDLSLQTVPEVCVQATLATEDSRFYYHMGFDPLAISRAGWQNVRAGGRVVSGGSTLTQQLVRILLMDETERYEQTVRRKLREAWLAWRLEHAYAKDELLALYLNQSYYGHFAFGLEAAAQTFFAKPTEQLSRGECALLAGLVQYPSGYDPLLQPEIAKNRQLTVLRLMYEAGYLSPEEMAQVASEPLRYRTNLFEIQAPHFVMYVQDLVAREMSAEQIRQGGFRVVTSLDLDLQSSVETAVRRQMDLLNCRAPGLCTPATNPGRRVDNAAAVVLDARSGAILALVGSPDYFDESIQGNVNAALTLRQPGSAMKPFTYAVALDPGWSERLGIAPLTAAAILPDLPATFHIRDESGGSVPYQPVNYDRHYHGPVSVRTALASSYNIPAVKVLDRIGVESLRSVAMQAGISSLTGDYGLALTLGGGEVSLLELTSAYGIFLDGTRIDPVALLDIQQRDSDGNWKSLMDHRAGYVHAADEDRVIGAETAYLLTDILSDNAARIPAFGEDSVLDLPFPAAAKTGTTTDWRDNWTVGYSTDRIVGVWVGNADNKPMLDVSGIDGAGPIWRNIMLEAHRVAPTPFSVPEMIATLEVCAPSGLLPSEHCTYVHREVFIQSTEPATVDDQFRRAVVDARTGLLATDATPDQYRRSRVFWRLPVEYRDWMTARQIPISPGDYEAQAVRSLATSALSEEGFQEGLHLVSPISNTAYQIHPALPRASQRIQIRGSTPSGTDWAVLRLVVDGSEIAEQEHVADLDAWWPLEPGEHRIWIEGQETASGPLQLSDVSIVQVDVFERNRDALALQRAIAE